MHGSEVESLASQTMSQDVVIKGSSRSPLHDKLHGPCVPICHVVHMGLSQVFRSLLLYP